MNIEDSNIKDILDLNRRQYTVSVLPPPENEQTKEDKLLIKSNIRNSDVLTKPFEY